MVLVILPQTAARRSYPIVALSSQLTKLDSGALGRGAGGGRITGREIPAPRAAGRT
jgi:hypothetical protein